MIGIVAEWADSALVTSLLCQTSNDWVLLDAAASTDDLVRVSHVAFLDGEDRLPNRFVEWLTKTAARENDLGVIYTDEDWLDDGRRIDAFLKPGWSPERFRFHDYVGRSAWFSKQLLCRTEPVRPLAVQNRSALFANAETITHLPVIGLHSGSAPQLPTTLAPAASLSKPEPRVSIIIPTAAEKKYVRGRNIRLIELATESIAQRTDYPNFEIVIVADRRVDPGLMDDVARSPSCDVHWVQNPRRFNFSEACNLGAESSSGEVFVFLNDDTEILKPDWLRRLTALAFQPGVGAAGATLVYEDGRIQHAGIWSRDGIPGHRYPGFAADFPGVRGSLLGPQNCLAVTGACLAVESVKFSEVGGFSTDFPMNFNDVDLCLRLLRAGYRSVVDPSPSVAHFESATREPSATTAEYELLADRWSYELHNDFWDHPAHVAPAPNEYPAPLPAFTAFRERLNLAVPPPRIWSRKAGKPIGY